MKPSVKLYQAAAAVMCMAVLLCVSIVDAQQAERPMPWHNSRMVYVSPTGDDANSGLSAEEAVQTVERGMSLLRSGQPDWLLLERGHDYELAQAINQPAGAAGAMPVVIAAYGEGDSPELNVGPNTDKLNQSQQATSHITVYDVTLTGLDNPFPILQPGNGWTGETPQPDPVGVQGMPGYDAKAIARWDVVPYQTFDEKFHIGVVAFHMNGIDRVSFSVDNGPWVDVHEMQLNPRTEVWEYTVTLDADEFAQDGPIEVRAIAWPDGAGEPRVLAGAMAGEGSGIGEHSMFLSTNSLGTLPQLVRYVSPTGSDTSGDGTRNTPYASMMKAARSIQDEQGKNADGGTIYLLPGDHLYGQYSYGLQTQTHNRWLTITAAPGLAYGDAKIVGHNSEGGLRISLVHLHNIQVLSDGSSIFRTNGPLEDHLWVSNSTMAGPDRHGSAGLSGGWSGTYVTNTTISKCRDGGSFRLARDVAINEIGSDALSNSSCVINCTVSDIDREDTEYHPDVFQIYGHPGNIVVYGLTANAGIDSQGLFAGANVPVYDVAFVNCSLTTIGFYNVFQFGGATEHMLVLDSELSGASNWRNDLGFFAVNILVRDTVFNNGSSQQLPIGWNQDGIAYVQTP